MLNERMTRAEFLRSLALLGFGVAGSGAVISGCGGGGKEETGTTSRPAKKASASDPCADVSGLTDTELTMRNQTLQYVSVSPDPEKLCDNCKFWEPPAEGAPCGGCQLIKGPIHPKGYCTSWFVADT